jgi:DNA invertase Pin-like site-specific DNA recombinase
VSIVAEYTDIESGSHDKRPELMKAVSYASKNDLTLCVAKLDRLSRNFAFLMAINEQVQKGKLDVCALNVPTFNTMTIGILATMAQFEREQTSIRTKAALKAKKERGESVGRTITNEEREASHKSHREASKSNENNLRAWGYISECIENNNAVNYSEIARKLNKHGFITAKGGKWQAVQVQRLVKLMNE